MTEIEVINAIRAVLDRFCDSCEENLNNSRIAQPTKGGYFRVGNIAIKISEITDLS